jgi:polysaccharide biosynthesis/export protein
MKKSNLANVFMMFLFVLMLVTFSCVPYSKLKYFNDIYELSEPVVNPVKSKTINPFDKLNINVVSTDEQTATILNSGLGTSDVKQGYVVDENGNITFPFAGNIHVGGLKLLEAGEVIGKAISSIIIKPVVLVTFIDKKITVLGEVVNQGTYIINDDFINIYESLSRGGGLTPYADRKKVILLRKENNKLMNYTLDLSNSKITASPFYYILPNDIIIVEPIRKKSGSYQNSVLTTLLTSVATVVGIIYLMRYSKYNF